MSRITIDNKLHHRPVSLPTGLRKGISQAWTNLPEWTAIAIGCSMVAGIGFAIGRCF